MTDLFGGLAGRTDEPEVLAELEVDYTPVGVALALVQSLGLTPGCRVLCPAAGSGAFPRAVRAVTASMSAGAIDAHERRASEAENLSRCCDRVVIGDFVESLARGDYDGAGYDLVVDNPPFSWFELGLWLEMFRRGVASDTVALLGLSQWGQSEQAWRLLREHSPSLQVRVGGRVGFRPLDEKTMRPVPKSKLKEGGPTHEARRNATDSREYSLWVWLAGDPGCHSWSTLQLPPMPAELRTWRSTSVPGTYEIDQEQVRRVVEALKGGAA